MNELSSHRVNHSNFVLLCLDSMQLVCTVVAIFALFWSLLSVWASVSCEWFFFLVVFIESCIHSFTLGLFESLIVCVCSAIVECHANAREQRSTRTLYRCGANECVCIHAVSCCFCLVALLLCCTDTAPKNQIPHGERVRKSDRRVENRKIFVLWAVTMRHTTHMCCCWTSDLQPQCVTVSLSLSHTHWCTHITHTARHTLSPYTILDRKSAASRSESETKIIINVKNCERPQEKKQASRQTDIKISYVNIVRESYVGSFAVRSVACVSPFWFSLSRSLLLFFVHFLSTFCFLSFLLVFTYATWLSSVTHWARAQYTIHEITPTSSFFRVLFQRQNIVLISQNMHKNNPKVNTFSTI